MLISRELVYTKYFNTIYNGLQFAQIFKSFTDIRSIPFSLGIPLILSLNVINHTETSKNHQRIVWSKLIDYIEESLNLLAINFHSTEINETRVSRIIVYSACI